MCGFFGVVDTNEVPFNSNEFSDRADSISHRGPDGRGVVQDAVDGYNFTFSHFRLSIQGIGDSGIQPWIHEDLVVLYNGEIYNYNELRYELTSTYGIVLNTKCDTELIPWLYRIYGSEFVSQIKGMFSIVILDKKLQEITFYRDYFGIKPLYYCINNSQIFFSSELSAFKGLGFKENLEAFNSYFIFSYNIFSESFFCNVYELKRSTYLNISLRTKTSFEIKHICWTPKLRGGESSNYIEIISSSVKSQLISDVPIAISLSGGFDSSILSYYTKQHLSQIKAYTVDFGFNHEDVYNAKEVCRKLSISLNVIDANLYNVCYFSLLNEVYNNISEPIADSAYIGTYLVSKAARDDGYTVLLSGAGGDEIFGGYTRYAKFGRNSAYYFANLLAKLLPRFMVSRKLYNPRFNLLTNTAGCYREFIKLGSKINFEFIDKLDSNYTYPSFVEMMDFDLNYYLVNDILKLTDLASMKCGVEVRVPFLDYDLYSNVRSAFSLSDYVFKNETKTKLKKDFLDVLPPSLYKMKKMGFGAPVDHIIDSCKNEIIEYIRTRESYLKNLVVKFDYSKVSNNFLFHLFVYLKWRESF